MLRLIPKSQGENSVIKESHRENGFAGDRCLDVASRFWSAVKLGGNSCILGRREFVVVVSRSFLTQHDLVHLT